MGYDQNQIIWSEERIRGVFKELDLRTGLHAASLPIVFNRSLCVLGRFVHTSDGKKWFVFSKSFLDDTSFAYESALDLFKHEYAHYMSYVIYGQEGTGHGWRWKQCVKQIGGITRPCFDDLVNDYWNKQNVSNLSLVTFPEGTIILHHRFGEGKVIDQNEDCTQLTILFKEGVKKLSSHWVSENCQIILLCDTLNG